MLFHSTILRCTLFSTAVLLCSSQEVDRYGTPLLTFLGGLNRGVAKVENTLERVPGAATSVVGQIGRATGGEAARAAENVVRVASGAAGAARPVIKGTLALRQKLDFLKKSLDAVEAAGNVIRGEQAPLASLQ